MKIINYVSAEPLYSEVKEELNSYFEAGSADDLLFPKWTSNAMDNFGMTSKPIKESSISLQDFKAELPCDFDSVRELWSCSNVIMGPYQSPTSYYYQTDCRISVIEDRCNECFGGEIDCCDECSDDHPKNQNRYRVTHKTTGEIIFEYNCSHLLRPVDIQACGHDCPNLNSHSHDTFRISNKNIFTNFRSGMLHLVYYSDNSDNEGGVLIPEHPRVKDYIKKFLIYKTFQYISNQVIDESYNIINQKKVEAKYDSDEAFIIASTELKKWSIWDTNKYIKHNNSRNNIYRRTIR